MRSEGRVILAHLLICAALSVAGLALSYGVLESAPWFWAYGAFRLDHVYENLGGAIEGIRFVVLAGCFSITQMLFRSHSGDLWTAGPAGIAFYRNVFRVGSLQLRLACILAASAVVVYHSIVGPIQLNGEYAKHVLHVSPSRGIPPFRDYVAPYLAYMPYSVTNYLLLALPTFIVVVRAIGTDREALDGIAERTRALLQGADTEQHPYQRAIQVEGNLLTLRETLAEIANRYLFMASLVWLYFSLELGTNMLATLACWAQELTKWSAWLFIGAVVPYFLVRAASRVSSIHVMADDTLEHLARAAATDEGAAEKINGLRGRVGSQFTVFGFFQGLAKGGSLVAFLLVVIGLPLAKAFMNEKPQTRAVAAARAIPYPAGSLALYAWKLLTPTESINKELGMVPSALEPLCTRRSAPDSLMWRGKPLKAWASR